ncbi:MAG: DUF2007 domain-containing protein [Desulfitobacterium sp.]
MKKWLFLTNVTTEIEADIVIALLEQAEIPTRKAFPGSGNLKATYGLINGVEIYVPEDWMEQAKEILEAVLKTSSTG